MRQRRRARRRKRRKTEIEIGDLNTWLFAEEGWEKEKMEGWTSGWKEEKMEDGVRNKKNW